MFALKIPPMTEDITIPPKIINDFIAIFPLEKTNIKINIMQRNGIDETNPAIIPLKLHLFAAIKPVSSAPINTVIENIMLIEPYIVGDLLIKIDMTKVNIKTVNIPMKEEKIQLTIFLFFIGNSPNLNFLLLCIKNPSHSLKNMRAMLYL